MTMSISYSILNKSIKFGPVDVGSRAQCWATRMTKTWVTPCSQSRNELCKPKAETHGA